MSSAARTAATYASPTTPAATGIVRSAKPSLPRSGWPTARPNCCRFPTSMSSSPCRDRSPTSALTHHPHAHIIVPGGGVSFDGRLWIACRPRFLLAVPVLSRLFRRLFLERLTAAHQAGRLEFFADQAALAEPAAFQARLAALRKVEWVVYAKRPFGGPGAVLAYLS